MEGGEQAVVAHAKLNLHLRVLDRGVDGYRHLETLFVRIDFGDRLSFGPAGPGLHLEVAGDAGGAAREDNLVWRAAAWFYETASLEPGVRIHLEKEVPPGMGLGGGSADAGTTLRTLNAWHDSPLEPGELAEGASRLGADVPFFTTGADAAWGTGRGDRLLVVQPPPSRPLLLALPALHLDTGQVYRAFNDVRAEAGQEAWAGGSVLDLEQLTDWGWLAAHGGNDFEAVVHARHPELGHLRDAMGQAEGALLSRMSGSGAAHFAVFSTPEAAEQARERLITHWPDVRFRVCRTLPSG